MRHQEYERRRRALEQQLQADLDLIRAAYAAKLRALEAVWLHSPEEGEPRPDPPKPEAPAEPLPSETPLSETAPIETPPEEPVRAPVRRETLRDLRAALSGLPELFEKEDVYQALGYMPPRATLYRAFQTLLDEKKVSIARYSEGGTRTQYRRLV
jgi:hypothetical protein